MKNVAVVVSLLLVCAVAATGALTDFGASSNPGPMTVFGSHAYFFATTPAAGHELWRTDGTNVELVKDIAPGTASGFFQGISPRLMELNGALYFYGSEGTNGSLWKTDGTAAGTVKVLELPLRPASPLVVANGRLFLHLARSIGVFEVWTSDGTAGGTQLLQGATDDGFAAAGLYFFINGSGTARSVWRSDGTPAGTFPLPIGDITSFAVNGGYVYIIDRQLVRTDGTVAGTVTIPSSSFVRDVAVAGGTTYFANDSGSPELWKTDGTPQGTVLVKRFPNSGYVAPYGGGSQLFFALSFSASSRPGELWRSDGTESGTTLVKAITPFAVSASEVLSIARVAVGDRLYFAPFDYTYGREPWRSDGTADGTFVLADVDPRRQTGNASSDPSFLLAWNGAVYFSANDVHGRELWRTDGTAEGTRMVANLNPEGTIRVHGFDRRNGAPAPGTVTMTTSGRSIGTFPLDADGRVVIEGVRPGTYSLQLFDTGLYLPQVYDRLDCPPCPRSQWASIRVDADQTVDADFPLTLGGRISGRVLDAATGLPLQWPVWIQDRLVSPTFTRTTASDEEGNYATQDGLPPGNYVVFAPGFPGYSMQVWRDIPCHAGCGSATTPTVVSVREGETVTGIDFALKTNGIVRGTIRDAMTGEPVGNGRVDASPVGSAFPGGFVDPVGVGPDGTFEIQLPDGPHTLFWTAGSGLPAYRTTQFPNVTCNNCNTHGGTPVIAIPGETTSGYDIALEPVGARFRGTVRDALTRAPIRNARVIVYRDAQQLTEVVTAADGRWSTTPFLTPGTYTVLVLASPYSNEFYGGQHCTSPCDPRRAPSITVTDRSIVEIDTAMDRPGAAPPRRRRATGR